MTYFLLSNIKEDILKNVGKQTVSVPIDFHYMDEEKKNTVVNWKLKLFGYQHSSEYLLLCSIKKESHRFGTT